MTAMSDTQAALLSAFVAANPGVETFDRQDMFKFAEENGFSGSAAYTLLKRVPRAGRGIYQMSAIANVVAMPRVAPAPRVAPEVVAETASKAVPAPSPRKVTSTSSEEVYVPASDPTFVKWGYFTDVAKVINSRMFYPMYVAGLSGNGKTMMIEQACAASKREYVRVQITPETDEDDLIGGFRLLDGETVFAKGPVIKAMEAGAILLIDEIDRGSNKLMCLQGILEGKPFMIKKTGEVVVPAPGFNVIATANTKGQGDENGRFIAATIIDEAFLERFTITIEQPYPSASIEKRIINNHMKKFGVDDADFVEKLVAWGQAIRKTFEDGGIEDMISTRRLCHIVQTFSIFGNRVKAIELCVNRFDADTRAGFLDLYTKIDVQAVPVPADTVASASQIEDEIPF